MTLEDFILLSDPVIREKIEENLTESPDTVALKLRNTAFPAALIASQIKYLQKAKKKLPEWFEKRCIFTRTSYEQSSSSQTVGMKFDISGQKALDLTCGQGVDSWGLSQHFEQVTAIEFDPIKARMARYNLALLGAENVMVHEADAREMIHTFPDQSFDLLYIDPARRDQQDKRKTGFEDCEPDILPLLPAFFRVARTVWIKASPMIRIEDALEQLGKPADVRVIAVQGECREVIFCIGEHYPGLRKAIWNRDGMTFQFEKTISVVSKAFPGLESARFILEADVALYKAEIAAEWFDTLPENGGMNHPMGYFFAKSMPVDFAGRAFRILESVEYKPKALKKMLRNAGISSLHISSRNFDIPVSTVRKALGIPEGEGGWLLLTLLPDKTRMAFLAEKIN